METIVAGLITGWITLLVLAMSWTVKGRLDAFENRLEEFGDRLARVEGIVGQLVPAVARLQSEVEKQGAELRALRSDVTQIAIALGARGRPETG